VALPAPSFDELPEPPARSFASDNASGVHPEVMAAIVAADAGDALAYGDDPWTREAEAALADLFGREVEAVFCWGGTGANVVGLQCLVGPGDAVICPEGAHIDTDEGGAAERIIGTKLLTVPTPDGKLRPADVLARSVGVGNQHRAQPRAVSITQSTERGTLYRPDEVRAVVEAAHAGGLRVHLDGARIANAAAALGGDVRSFTTDAGVDVLTFGGTKNGLMYGEAVVFLEPELGDRARFVRKQTTQLASKMRYIGAQFAAALADGLWLRNAAHANAMARLLADGLAGVDGVTVTSPPEVNAVFAALPSAGAVEDVQAWSFVHDWDPARHEVRCMTSWATTPTDVERFVAGVAAVVERHLA
jgi:threonine aldolase